MLLSREEGAAAILAMLAVLMGIIFLGLLLDIGGVAVRRAQLDQAVEAAARAALVACPAGPAGTIDSGCAAGTAVRYLQANLPAARADLVTVEPPARVTVRASVTTPHAFAGFWGAQPVRLQSQASISGGT